MAKILYVDPSFIPCKAESENVTVNYNWSDSCSLTTGHVLADVKNIGTNTRTRLRLI